MGVRRECTDLRSAYAAHCAELCVALSEDVAGALPKELAALEVVDCGDMALGDSGVRAVLATIAGGPAVRVLRLHGNCLSAVGVSDCIRCAGTLPALEELDLRGGDLTVAGPDLLGMVRDSARRVKVHYDGTLLPYPYRRLVAAARKDRESSRRPEGRELSTGFVGVAEEVRFEKLRQSARKAARQHDRERDAMQKRIGSLEAELQSLRGLRDQVSRREAEHAARLAELRDQQRSTERMHASQLAAAAAESERLRKALLDQRQRHIGEMSAERYRMEEESAAKLRAQSIRSVNSMAQVNLRAVRTRYFRMLIENVAVQRRKRRLQHMRRDVGVRTADILRRQIASEVQRIALLRLRDFARDRKKRGRDRQCAVTLFMATSRGHLQATFDRLRELVRSRRLMARRLNCKESLLSWTLKAATLSWWRQWVSSHLYKTVALRCEKLAANASEQQVSERWRMERLQFEYKELLHRLQATLSLCGKRNTIVAAAWRRDALLLSQLLSTLRDLRRENASLQREVETLRRDVGTTQAAPLSDEPPPLPDPPTVEEDAGRKKVEAAEAHARAYLKRLLSRIEKPFGKTGSVGFAVDTSQQAASNLTSPQMTGRRASFNVRGRKREEAPGVLLKRVMPGGAAEKAGLSAGDVVLAIRNPRSKVSVSTPADLLDQIGPLGHVFEGVTITLTVRRVTGRVEDVRFQMGAMAPAAKHSRLRHLERTLRPVFGPAFDPAAAYDLEHDPVRCRKTLKAVFDEGDVSKDGTLELSEIHAVVSRMAARLGVPPPPADKVSAAMEEADIDQSGDLEFEEFFYYLRDLFMDVIYPDGSAPRAAVER